MNKNRLEAFSDGVFAIILTIMVLELKVPSASDPEAFVHLRNHLSSYALSYAYVAIYWVNHHHTFHAIQKVDGKALWLNILLLFFLSLFPFCTAWVGGDHFASLPVFVYGLTLLAAALAYTALVFHLARLHGPDSVIAQALGEDTKGKASTALYLLGTLLAFWQPYAGYACFVAVAFIWIVPDTRIEKRLLAAEKKSSKRS
jgi:uncharacterized membrane protein